jgi:HK97 family phage prohead protease
MEIKQKLYSTKAEDLDKKGRVLIAVNAFDNVDADGDISKPGSFKKTLAENFNRVRWFLNHDVTILLGVPIKGYEEGNHLKMQAQFNLEKQVARDTYEDYKLYAEHGKSLEHSVGLQAIKWAIDETKGIRTISEWKLWEFSTLTHWGANENTPLLGIKQLEQMANNPNYSDDRKRTIEHTYKALFVEPARSTLDDKAAMQEITKLFFNTFNT